MQDNLNGAAWRGHTVEVSSSEVLTSTDAGPTHQHERLFSALNPLTFGLKVPLTSCSCLFPFLLHLYCAYELYMFLSERKEI